MRVFIDAFPRPQPGGGLIENRLLGKLQEITFQPLRSLADLRAGLEGGRGRNGKMRLISRHFALNSVLWSTSFPKLTSLRKGNCPFREILVLRNSPHRISQNALHLSASVLSPQSQRKSIMSFSGKGRSATFQGKIFAEMIRCFPGHLL